MAVFTTILGSAFLAAVANALVSVAISAALSFAVQSLQKKPKAQTQALDFEQTVQRRLRNGQGLEVLVGKRIVAGVGFFDDAYGTKNEYGVSVSVLSAKPCTQFHRLFLDGEPVELSGDPTTGEVVVTSHFLGIPAPQTVDGGWFNFTFNTGEPIPRVAIRCFLGDDNSGVGEYLASKFPSQFTAGDDFGDYCVLVVVARNTNDDLDEEDGKNYIPFQGFPEFKAEMSGVKVCDPRIAGASYDDESTYVYSANAALVDAQYDYGWYSGVGAGRSLIVGNGYPTALMEINQIIANADYCQLEGFNCSGVVRSGDTGDQEEIWKCYNADRVEHAASVFSIPEGNRTLGEPLDLSDYPAAYVSFYDEDGYSTEVYNEVRTVYAEPEEFYGEKDLPIYSRPEWIASDNHIPRQMSLPLLFVTDKVQAGKLEKQEINISRVPSTCSINDLPFGFIRTRVGSVFPVSGSDVEAINGRTWIVKGRGQTARGDISLQLHEYAGTVAFDFDETTETPAPFITPPIPRPWEDWYGPTDYVPPNIIGNFDRLISGELEVSDIRIVGRGSLNTDNDARDQNINTALNTATAAGGGSLVVDSVFPSQAAGADDAQLGSISTGSVAITLSGGTAPFNVSNAKVSGDTLTVNQSVLSNVITVSFSGTPGPAPDSLSAVYKFTITDSSSPQESVEVNVPADIVRFEDFGGSGGIEP